MDRQFVTTEVDSSLPRQSEYLVQGAKRTLFNVDLAWQHCQFSDMYVSQGDRRTRVELATFALLR